MGVSKNERAPRAAVIDVFIAVFIPYMRALSFGKKQWGSAYRAKGTHRRVNTPGKIGFGFFKKFG
jgi:hypothetical protein